MLLYIIENQKILLRRPILFFHFLKLHGSNFNFPENQIFLSTGKIFITPLIILSLYETSTVQIKTKTRSF